MEINDCLSLRATAGPDPQEAITAAASLRQVSERSGRTTKSLAETTRPELPIYQFCRTAGAVLVVAGHELWVANELERSQKRSTLVSTLAFQKTHGMVTLHHPTAEVLRRRGRREFLPSTQAGTHPPQNRSRPYAIDDSPLDFKTNISTGYRVSSKAGASQVLPIPVEQEFSF